MNVSKRNRKWLPIMIVAILLSAATVFIVLTFCQHGQKRRKTISVEIPEENVQYVICYYHGDIRRLDYSEHPEAIDHLIETLNGEYYYVKSMNKRGVEGGGPDGISFYYGGKTDSVTVYYEENRIAAATARTGYYDLYEKEDAASLSLDEFEDYLERFGSTGDTKEP